MTVLFTIELRVPYGYNEKYEIAKRAVQQVAVQAYARAMTLMDDGDMPEVVIHSHDGRRTEPGDPVVKNIERFGISLEPKRGSDGSWRCGAVVSIRNEGRGDNRLGSYLSCEVLKWQ